MKNKNANKRDFLAAPVAGGKGAGLAYSGAVVLFIALQLIVSVVLAANGWTDSAALAKKDWYLYLSFLVSPLAFGLVALWYLKKKKTRLPSLHSIPPVYWGKPPSCCWMRMPANLS